MDAGGARSRRATPAGGEAVADADPRPGRTAELWRRVAEAGLEGLLVGHLPNVRYLTGFSGSAALLLVLGRDRLHLLTDFRYEEQAAEECLPWVSLRIAQDGLFRELEGLLERDLPRRLGFEADHLTVRDRRELGERCGGVAWEAAPPLVEGLRARKDETELALIRTAIGIAERALEETLQVVCEGVAEFELAAELEYRLRRAGSGALPFVPIVATGPRSALPHAEPGERRVVGGDLLLFDFGASRGGYCCDLTRTFVAGTAAPWQREVHEAVLEAQEAAIAAIEAGRGGAEVDRAARRCLEARGWAERFGHSTGHGIGLEVHEGPRLARRSEDVLEAGNVVTVEPGVYLSARGGVRVEDDVVVDDEGARSLTRFSRDLQEL